MHYSGKGGYCKINGYFVYSQKTEADLQKFKYTGKEFDKTYGLNLYDYGARFYDPRLCSWTSQDPLADKYYGVSSYVYCVGNPIAFVDPNGEHPAVAAYLIALTKAAAIGMATEYATQGVVNLIKGEEFMDAWIYKIDYADVLAGAYNPKGKFNLFATFTQELAKALVSIDYEGNFDINYKDPIGVIFEASVGTSIDGVFDFGSNESLKIINNESRASVRNSNVAHSRTQRKPQSPKAQAEKEIADKSLSNVSQGKIVAEKINGVVGSKPEAKKNIISIIYENLKADEKKK